MDKNLDELPSEIYATYDIYKSPDEKFIKTVTSKGFGYYGPQDGSVCKIKVIQDEKSILSDVNTDSVKELIVGDVDDPIDRILEACVRTMKNEETCILKFFDPSHPCPVGSFSSSPSEYENIKDQCNVQCDSNDVPMNDEGHETSSGMSESNDSDVKTSDSTTESGLGDELISSNAEKNKEISDKTESDKGESNYSNKCKTDNVQKDKLKDPMECIPNSDSNESFKEPMDCESYNGTELTIYEVHMQLLMYSREPEIYEMSITEKWRRANYHKQKGMELYSRGSYEWAFRRFGLSVKYLISLEHDLPSGHEEGMNINGMKLSCFLNLAACQMRHHNYASVVKNCTKALELQEDNFRALYRRGSALVQLQEYERAKEDLDKAQTIEPKNQAVIKQQQLLKSKVQKLNEYYAAAMKKMFS